ncbi:MAG: GAF domain-containing protein [Armatimonadetes bacterium]|nr:GAF domain-containing protein [Armatimonadota bacterium]
MSVVMDPNELESLRKRVTELEAELAQLRANPNAGMTKGQEGTMEAATPITEGEATLKRLVQRIAMILQADKIVIMFHDREKGELIGIPPAYGVDEAILSRFRVRATQGISGEVFREGEPITVHDAITDPRTEGDHIALLGVNNLITVPLVIEKRDDENRVIDKTMIGVLHAFNKRHNEEFNDEDVRLLERMAKNVGSIIANLQLYREVVEEREELLQTFESLTAGLMLVAPDGHISQANSSARAVFGWGNEAIGKVAGDLLGNQPTLLELFAKVQSGQECPSIEIDIVIGGSDRIYQVQAAQVKGEDQKDLGVVSILSDITEIKNIERMKSSFVAMASHELRTPLTAIKGFSSTLLEGVDDDMFEKEEQKEFLGIVVHECDRLRRLIDDLLNTSRIEAGESLKPSYSEVDITQLIYKVQKIQQQSTTKHVIKVAIENDLPPLIVGDQDKLDQSLTNLLNNAIKYAPEGGDVTIHAKNEGDTLLIGIEDQGLGIPKDHLGKVFEKFHRVNNEDNRKIYGTGLGLYLVKHLIESVHMGTIWAESEVGVGSTFWFRIPTKIDIEEANRLND